MQNDPMVPGVHANLEWELERIVDCVRSLEDRGAARRPSAPDANSVAGIAAHALGAAREHVLGWALGEQTEPGTDAFEDDVSRLRQAAWPELGGVAALLAPRD